MVTLACSGSVVANRVLDSNQTRIVCHLSSRWLSHACSHSSLARMPALLGHSLLSSGISMLAESLLSNIRGHRDALGPGCKHVFQAVSTHIQVEILQAGPFMELSPMVERHQGFLEAAPQGPVSRNMPPLHLAPLTEPGWKSKTPKTGANLCHFAASLG